jgi:pilus assembly protein CpaE
MAAAAVGPSAAPANSGTVFTIASATGGCGKTFFATNLAYYFTRLARRTCLVDLDLQFGELSSALRIKPKATIADLAGSTADDEDLGRRLEECLEHHDTGIQMLAAPDEPAEADSVDGADVARVIEAARARFDCVVLDTPAALTDAVLVALEHADHIFALATLDLPSVRNLGVLLTTLTKLKVPSERVKLVLNKVEPDVGMDVERIKKYFPQGFSVVIPYGREVNRALNMGVPILAFAPGTAVGAAVESSLRELFDDAERELGEGGGGRRRRLLGRRRKSPA